MKKLFTLLIVGLFILSIVSLVFAQRGDARTAASQEIQERRDAVKASAQEVRSACGGENRSSDACKTAQNEAREKAKVHVEKVLDNLEMIANKMLVKLDSFKHPPVNKDEVKVEIQEFLSQIDGFRERLDALPADFKRADLHAIVVDIRQAWVDFRGHNYAHRILASRMHRVLERLEGMENVLSEKGIDTSELEATLEKAKNELDQGKIAWQNDDVQGAKTHLRAAKEQLRQAAVMVRKLMEENSLEVKPAEVSTAISQADAEPVTI